MNLINLEKLVELRKQKGISQADLARKTGVTRFQIHHIESGRVNPGLALAVKIANILGCKVDDLIFFDHHVDFKGTEKKGDSNA